MIRVGLGYDVHQLVEGRKLILGGVDIAFEKGLLGHSDADVLVHSIMDAILGALAEGDIGKKFPDTDMKYKDISSLLLLEQVRNLMDERGYEVSNIDATVAAERPKLAGYIDQMRSEIAKVLDMEVADLNIKATTTEKLGFVGREEGMSSYAVVLLKKKLT